eukprot:11673364-Alexandrium_andersonii.AAC.1
MAKLPGAAMPRFQEAAAQPHDARSSRPQGRSLIAGWGVRILMARACPRKPVGESSDGFTSHRARGVASFSFD